MGCIEVAVVVVCCVGYGKFVWQRLQIIGTFILQRCHTYYSSNFGYVGHNSIQVEGYSIICCSWFLMKESMLLRRLSTSTTVAYLVP